VTFEILYNSDALHRRIKHVLGDPEDRRVAIVAYVGAEAEAFFPHPEGMEIICDLKPGATSAEALYSLRKRGANVCKSDRLHAKVYWSQRHGAVITSANASRAALGKTTQKEVGVFFPKSSAIDIARLRRNVRPEAITLADLRKLARENARIPNQYAASLRSERADSFLDWMKTGELAKWKFFVGAKPFRFKLAEAARLEAKQSYGVRRAYDVILCSEKEIRKHDRILMLDDPSAGGVTWMVADFVARVKPSDGPIYDRKNPCQAVQVHPDAKYPPPPFKVDAAFRKALAKAVEEYGEDRLYYARRPPQRLLHLARKLMEGQM
jgi:hypothetical protein